MALWTKIKFPHIVERLRKEYPNATEEWLNTEYRRIARSSNYECLVEKYGKDKADEMKLKASKCHTLEGCIEKYGPELGPIRYQEMKDKRYKKNSLEGLTELYGAEEARRIMNERNIKSQNSKSLEGYIRRFGEEEGKRRYEKKIANQKKVNSLKWYKEKYGEEEGRLKYDQFRAKCSRANTLEGMKEKHGKEEGARLYKEMKDRQSFGQTLEGYMDKYGPEEGIKRYNEWRDKFGYSHTLQGYIDKFGEEEGTRRYNEAQSKRVYSSSEEGYIERYGPIEGPKKRKEWINKSSMDLENCIRRYGTEKGQEIYDSWVKSSRNTLENFISRYGAEEGTRRYNEANSKRAESHSYQSFIDKYGEDAEEKYREYLNSFKCPGGLSKISQELFDLLKSRLLELGYKESDIFYGKCEFRSKIRRIDINNLKSEESFNVRVDFYLKSEKKVIEFNGDYYHRNPSTNYGDIPDSEEIWKFDRMRERSIYYSDFCDSMVVVWERDYRANKQQVVEQLIEFLTNGKN